MIGIYKITNPLNEVYIGQSKDIERRFVHHKTNSSNKKLKQSIEHHGADNHKFEIICECSEDELNDKEMLFIKEYLIKGTIFNTSFYASNGGRKKLENKAYTIRCEKSIIADVRKYAKEKSEEFINNQKTN